MMGVSAIAIMKRLFVVIAFLAISLYGGVHATTNSDLKYCRQTNTSNSEIQLEFDSKNYYHNGMDVQEGQGVAYVSGDYVASALKVRICPISYPDPEKHYDVTCDTRTVSQNNNIDGDVAVMWDKNNPGYIMLAYRAGSITTSYVKNDDTFVTITTHHARNDGCNSCKESQVNLGFNGTNILIAYY